MFDSPFWSRAIRRQFALCQSLIVALLILAVRAAQATSVMWIQSPTPFFSNADAFRTVNAMPSGGGFRLGSISVAAAIGEVQLVDAARSPCDTNCAGLLAQGFEITFDRDHVAVDLQFALGGEARMDLTFKNADGEVLFTRSLAPQANVRAYAPAVFRRVVVDSDGAALLMTRLGGEPLPTLRSELTTTETDTLVFTPVPDGPGTPLISLAADPDNLRYVYGTDDQARLWRSVDAGAKWNPLDGPWDQVFDIGLAPNRSHVLIVASDSGLWRSPDRGTSWRAIIERSASAGAVASQPFERGLEADPGLLLSLDQTLWQLPADGSEPAEVSTLPSAIISLSMPRQAGARALTDAGTLYAGEIRAGASWRIDERFAHVGTIERFLSCESVEFALTAAGLWQRSVPVFSLSDTRPAVRTATRGFVPTSVSEHDGCFFTFLSDDALLIRDASMFWLDSSLFEASVFPISGGNPVGVELHRWATFDEPGQPQLPEGPVFSPLALSAEGVVLRGALLDRGSCPDDICPLEYDVERSGFHVIRFSLPPGAREGVFGLELQRVFGGLVAGAVLPERGRQPGFVAVKVEGCQQAHLRFDEYTGAIETLSLQIRRIEGDVRTTILGPLSIAPGDGVTTPELCDGDYVIAIRSSADDPRGRFGVEMTNAAFTQVSFGGWIDDSVQTPFIGVAQNESVNADIFYGANYPGVGAARPETTIRFLDAAGRRVVVDPPQFEGATVQPLSAIDRVLDPFGNQHFRPALPLQVDFAPETREVVVARYEHRSSLALDRCGLSAGQRIDCRIASRLPSSRVFGPAVRFGRRWLADDASEVVTVTDFASNGSANVGFTIVDLGDGSATNIPAPSEANPTQFAAHVEASDGFERFLNAVRRQGTGEPYIGVYDRSTASWFTMPPQLGSTPSGPPAFAGDGTATAWIEREAGELRVAAWEVGEGTMVERLVFMPELLRGDSEFTAEVVSVDWGIDQVLVNIEEIKPRTDTPRTRRNLGAYLVSPRTGEVTNLSTIGPEIVLPVTATALLDDGETVLLHSAGKNLLRNVRTGSLTRLVIGPDDEPVLLLHEADGIWLGSSSSPDLAPFDSSGEDYFLFR